VALVILIEGSGQGKLLEYLVPCGHFYSLLGVKSNWGLEITRRNNFNAAVLCDVALTCEQLFHVLDWVFELGRCGSEDWHLRDG
jgi:hypothetical protein